MLGTRGPGDAAGFWEVQPGDLELLASWVTRAELGHPHGAGPRELGDATRSSFEEAQEEAVRAPIPG